MFACPHILSTRPICSPPAPTLQLVPFLLHGSRAAIRNVKPGREGCISIA